MKAMHPCSDDAAFQWIRNGQEKGPARDDPNWRGNFVSRLIPQRFNAYAKILHRVEANYKYIDNPLSEREDAILKIPSCKKLRSFVENLRKKGRGPRIRWSTLAHLMGVPFAPEICHEWFQASMEPGCWPRCLFGPADGNLCAEELSEVLSLLAPFTGKQDCYFRFFQYSHSFLVKGEPIFFCGHLDELSTFLTDGKYQNTPEYWWPADHSWCLCSEYDLMFTLVGGSKELISAVLKDTTLEALEVTPQTRIDNYAPMPK
jgi:hypothetical protein